MLMFPQAYVYCAKVWLYSHHIGSVFLLILTSLPDFPEGPGGPPGPVAPCFKQRELVVNVCTVSLFTCNKKGYQ